MTFNLLVPDIENKPKNTKDAVINLLTSEWPLTLRQIFYKIKKQYNYSFTYQSVYKAVKELKERRVLLEKDKKYEINVKWVKRLQSFTDIVETNYYTKDRMQNISGLKESKAGQDLTILTFETIFDAEKYLYYFIKTELLKKKNKIICFQLTSEWRPLFYLRAEYNYYKKLMKRGHKFYFICSGDSDLEKKYKDFYKSIKTNYKITNQNLSNETIVFENYFIQIFIPEKLKIKIRQYLQKEDATNLLSVLETKSSIKVIVNKDEDLAEETKKKIVKQF